MSGYIRSLTLVRRGDVLHCEQWTLRVRAAPRRHRPHGPRPPLADGQVAVRWEEGKSRETPQGLRRCCPDPGCVFVPPDDESLFAGGLLAQHAGARVRTAVVTRTWAPDSRRAVAPADALRALSGVRSW